MVSSEVTLRTLVFIFDEEPNFRFNRIQEGSTNANLLRFGRAVNSLQRVHAQNFIKEVRTRVEG